MPEDHAMAGSGPEQLSTEDLYKKLSATAKGLSSHEAGQRLQRVGPNALEDEKQSPWIMFGRFWLVPAIPWHLIGFLWLYKLVWLLALDLVRVALYHMFELRETRQTGWQRSLHRSLDAFRGLHAR